MKLEKKSFYKLIILGGVIAVNIYPMSCFSSPPPTVVSPPINDTPIGVSVNIKDFTTALKCIQNTSKIATEKNVASNELNLISSYPSSIITIDKTQYDNFKNMSVKYNCGISF